MDADAHSSEGEYSLEYSEDSTDEPDVDLENHYYLAKAIKDENLHEAIDAFQKVIDLQCGDKGEWGFKALKQLVKIHFQLGNYEDTMTKYKEMLTYINGAVTKNHGEKSINSILDFTSSSTDIGMLRKFYETTLDVLKTTKNDRLWFKTNTKLGKVLLARGEFSKLASIIRQLKQCCKFNEIDSDNTLQGTQLLEIYALEIQMYSEQKNHKQLEQLYEQSLRVRSAIPHPLILSVIRECGGKMHLRLGNYAAAYSDFFEAFKNYDESGNSRRITSLKYLILTSMLMDSAINPFDSQEVMPYKNNPEIKAMTDLIHAYQQENMAEFERIFRDNRDTLNEDQFVNEHVEALVTQMRTKVLLNLIKPYKSIKISFMSEVLGISEEDVEDILVACILDNAIKGKIDQVKGVLVKNDDMCNPRYPAMHKVANVLGEISELIKLDEWFG